MKSNFLDIISDERIRPNTTKLGKLKATIPKTNKQFERIFELINWFIKEISLPTSDLHGKLMGKSLSINLSDHEKKI